MKIEERIRLFNGVGSWKTYTAEGKIPQIVMSDGPHGLRKQDFEKYADLNKSNIATCFPSASCIASSWDKTALKILGKSIALEALAENVNLVLGCGMNIKRSPLCGRNFEYFSEDPYLSGELAANYVNGMQEDGIGSCIKHFACNNQEKRRQTSSSNVDKKTLHEIYLRGFEIAIKKSQPVSVMCSYNKLNGIYTAQNKYLLDDILRKKWGFKGAVISDWGACINPAKCIKAGLDLAMPDSYGYFDEQIQNSLDKKELSVEELVTVNDRVVEMAEKLTEMRDRKLASYPDNSVYVDYASQYQKALSLACDSAVLLKNDGILPINLENTKKICIVGELAEKMKFQAGGSSHITTAEYPNSVEMFNNQGFETVYTKGYYSGFCTKKSEERKNRGLIAKAVEEVQKACDEKLPVLFFCGLTDAYEGEGFDRTTMQIPQKQLELYKKISEFTDDIIVVSFSGAPIDLSFAKNARAILHMYLCGEACGQAVVSLITGKVNPSGKLAETWPLKIEDTPCFNNFSKESDEVDYSEEMLVGYRWYEAKKIPVQYPFGFGKSYTTFEYSGLKIEKEVISENQTIANLHVNIKNTGLRAGAEIVQVYITRKDESYRQLRGFEKVYLEPGEEKTVDILLDDNSFKVYSLQKDCFYQIKGEYLIEVGKSIKEICLSESVFIEDGDDFSSEIELKNKCDESSCCENKFTISDSLGKMADSSIRVRFLLKILILGLIMMNKGKSREDPSVKISISAIKENPLESLISTSGGIISYKFAKRIVKWAN